MGNVTNSKELEKLLLKNGFVLIRKGKHRIYGKEGFPTIPLPIHPCDMPKGTANSILKKAGLK